jgi:hypothetical protein
MKKSAAIQQPPVQKLKNTGKDMTAQIAKVLQNAKVKKIEFDQPYSSLNPLH